MLDPVQPLEYETGLLKVLASCGSNDWQKNICIVNIGISDLALFSTLKESVSSTLCERLCDAGKVTRPTNSSKFIKSSRIHSYKCPQDRISDGPSQRRPELSNITEWSKHRVLCKRTQNEKTWSIYIDLSNTSKGAVFFHQGVTKCDFRKIVCYNFS